MPANTFFATAAAAVHAGARVRFVDCDPQTMAIDLADVAARIGPDTAAVVVVHIGGLISPGDRRARRSCARAAACTSSRTPRTRTAARSTAESAGTFGVAGALLLLPHQGHRRRRGRHDRHRRRRHRRGSAHLPRPGQGLVPRQLPHAHRRELAHERAARRDRARRSSRRLDEFIAARQALADALRRRARRRSACGTLRDPGRRASCNYYKYIAFLPDGIDRTAVQAARCASEFDIGLSGEVYDTPLHHQPVFSQLADRALPGAEWLCARHICLPLYPSLTESDADYVVESLAHGARPRVARGARRRITAS